MLSLGQAGSASEAGKAMTELGWEPIPLKVRAKDPKTQWKEPRIWQVDDIDREFAHGENIGVALGKRSNNVVDIDFDWPEAADVANQLLSALPSFGRPSAPASHRIVRSILSKGRYTFDLGTAAREIGAPRSMVLEVRGNGHQTMFPPSVHPQGERVTWSFLPPQLPDIDEDVLLRQCSLIAFLAVVLFSYPRVAGDRDNICLALAGTLVRAGMSNDEVDQLVALVARLASDDEWQLRQGKAAPTRERIDAGETAWGLPELCQRLGISAVEPVLRKWIWSEHPEATSVTTSREITIIRGELHSAVDRAEEALLAGGVPVYQRGGSLIHPVRLDSLETRGGVEREPGQIVLHQVTAPWLLEQLGRSATWWHNSKSGQTRTDPPTSVATQYLHRVGYWQVPTLVAVTQCPTLRPDGTILQTPGYDADTRLLYDPGDVNFPEVPLEPTKADAEEALLVLERPLRGFEFEDAASKSVAIAAMLTALVRRTIPTVPLFAIDAPAAGSGKTILAETVGIIAMGARPAMTSQGKNEEEDEKRLSSVLMAGDAVVVIDNCERQVGGDFLASMLTSEFVQTRILGRSEVVRLPTRVLVFATGNNLEIGGDLPRRTVVCRLNAGVERPETRAFDFDPRDEAMRDRAELVRAGLTILKAYITAGSPVNVSPLGSYERWGLVRGALVWLGRPDPVASMGRLVDADPKRNDLLQILRAWRAAYGGKRLTLAEMKKDYEKSDASPEVKELGGILIELGRGRDFSTRGLGRMLARRVDTVAGGLVLKAHGESSRGRQYQVVEHGVAASDAPLF